MPKKHQIRKKTPNTPKIFICAVLSRKKNFVPNLRPLLVYFLVWWCTKMDKYKVCVYVTTDYTQLRCWQSLLPILDVSSFLLDNSTLFWMLAPYSGRGYLILDVSTLFWIIWHLICKALECLKKFLCIGLLVPVGLQRAVVLHFLD